MKHARDPGRAPNRHDGEAGFTLVEALVAFMIVALTLTMGLQALGNGAAWARRGPAQAERIEEAVSILNGLIAAPNLRSGLSEGRFGDGEVWNARITDVTGLLVPHAKTPLRRIDLYAGNEIGGAPLLSTIAAGP